MHSVILNINKSSLRISAMNGVFVSSQSVGGQAELLFKLGLLKRYRLWEGGDRGPSYEYYLDGKLVILENGATGSTWISDGYYQIIS